MTFDEYKTLPGINASAICAGRKSMLHMHHYMTGGDDKDTPAMRWGRIVHAAILEPERFLDTVSLWEGKVRRGREWDACKDAAPDTELIVTPDEMEKLRAMQRNVWAMPEAADMLKTCETEQVVQWEGKYGKAKGRVDAIRPGLVMDYKTTANIEPSAFFRTAFNLAYHAKMGWYAHGIEIATGRRPTVRLIVQEASAPFDCWVCEMPDSIVRDGEEEAVEIARAFHVAVHLDHFPGVSEADKGIVQYELPGWATPGNEAIPEMEGMSDE